MKKFSSKTIKAKNSVKMTALSTRAIAANLILQVLDEGKSLSALIPEVQLSVKAQDLPLLQEICFGVCRVLPRLDQIIKRLVDKPLKGKTRIVHCLLLVGLYQLLYMRVPAHAAVDEVVNATKSLKSDSFRGLVNAVLRRFLREQDEILAIIDKNWQTLHPEWFVNKLKKAYPNWREIIEANNQKPPMWLRVNSQKNALETYRTLLEEQGVSSKTSHHPNALYLDIPIAVQKLPHFEEGAVTVQDLSAQWAATLLEPKNEEWILDACAAPGGKTTRILLDAPCSATGVIRRHPDIKWLRKETDIAQLVELQKKILSALWEKLKPNGVLLYATCSVLPEENCEQIQEFLNAHADAELLSLPFSDDKSAVGFQFIPQPNSGDGFYYAKLLKRAS